MQLELNTEMMNHLGPLARKAGMSISQYAKKILREHAE